MTDDEKHAREQRMLDLADADDEARGHVPDRDELRMLLAKYFVGPVTDEFIELVVRDFEEIHASRGLEMTLARDFDESPTRWLGKAWKEELPYRRGYPSPADMMMLLANQYADHDESLPQPRLFCPEIFVGTWQQLEPEPPMQERYLWHLSADGSFHSDSPDAPPDKKLWGVERDRGVTARRRRGELVEDRYTLVFRETPSWGPWSISGINPFDDEMAGVHLGYMDNTPFRFRRISKRYEAPRPDPVRALDDR